MKRLGRNYSVIWLSTKDRYDPCILSLSETLEMKKDDKALHTFLMIPKDAQMGGCVDRD